MRECAADAGGRLMEIANVIALSAWVAVGLNPVTRHRTTAPAEGAATNPLTRQGTTARLRGLGG